MSHDLRFLVISKNGKNFLQILHRYIDFPYLLRQYLHTLTHPIIHFFTFIQFLLIYLKKKFPPETQREGLTPNPPLPTPLPGRFSRNLFRNNVRISELQIGLPFMVLVVIPLGLLVVIPLRLLVILSFHCKH